MGKHKKVLVNSTSLHWFRTWNYSIQALLTNVNRVKYSKVIPFSFGGCITSNRWECKRIEAASVKALYPTFGYGKAVRRSPADS